MAGVSRRLYWKVRFSMLRGRVSGMGFQSSSGLFRTSVKLYSQQRYLCHLRTDHILKPLCRKIVAGVWLVERRRCRWLSMMEGAGG